MCEDRRAARKRAHEMAERIGVARRRGYARILRREIEALRPRVLEAYLEATEDDYDTYLVLNRQLMLLYLDYYFWLGDAATQREIKEQNPWL